MTRHTVTCLATMLFVLVSSSACADESAASDWQFCAWNGGECVFAGTRAVRFGTSRGGYTETLHTDGASCLAANFGDAASDWGFCYYDAANDYTDAGDSIDLGDGRDDPGDGPVCGDRACNGAERCDSCARDCGACPRDTGSGEDRAYVELAGRHVQASGDVKVRFSGDGTTRTATMSNYCGAPSDQSYNVPCEYDGAKFDFALSSRSASGPGRVTLTVLGDHDSDPLGEDDEFIRVRVDGHDLGTIFDHRSQNDEFDFPSDRGNLSSRELTSTATIPQAEMARIVEDGRVEVVLEFLGGSHDDYTPWSGVQEYFEVQISY